jgi:hypothetical protein
VSKKPKQSQVLLFVTLFRNKYLMPARVNFNNLGVSRINSCPLLSDDIIGTRPKPIERNAKANSRATEKRLISFLAPEQKEVYQKNSSGIAA